MAEIVAKNVFSLATFPKLTSILILEAKQNRFKFYESEWLVSNFISDTYKWYK